MFLITKDGKQFEVEQSFIFELEKAFKNINVYEELDKIAIWLDSNPSKRKTMGGMKRFINTWISRADDRSKKGLPLFTNGTEKSGGAKNPGGMDNLTDVSWIDGEVKEAAKQRYLLEYGQYWDGERKTV